MKIQNNRSKSGIFKIQRLSLQSTPNWFGINFVLRGIALYCGIFCLFYSNGLEAQMVGSNAYIVGANAEIGIDGFGGFEGCSTIESPPFNGMHPRSENTIFGFVANVNNGNWSEFDGDFFTPGSAENGWGFTIGNFGVSAANNSFNEGLYPTIPGSITNFSQTLDCISITWEGDFTDGTNLHFKINYLLRYFDRFYTTTVSITNNTTETIPAFYYYRNLDPDNNQSINGYFDTQNTIVQQPSAGGCGIAQVSATQPDPWLSYIAFAAAGENWRAGRGGFSNRNGEEMWNGNGFGFGYDQTVGSTEFSDESIYLANRIQNFAPGATERFKFVVILNDALANTATGSLFQLNYPGAPSVISSECVSSFDTTVICLGQSLPMSLSLGSSTQSNVLNNYNWSWSPSLGLNTSTGTSVISSPAVTTNYTVTGTPISSNCGLPVSLSLVVKVLQGTPLSVNSPTICAGQSDTLTAVGGTIYSWDNGSTQNQIIVSPSTTTDYSVLVSNANGCSGTLVSTVTVNPLPIGNAGLDTSLCSGNSIQLNANGGLTYSWLPVSGLNNAQISNPVLSINSSTLYTVTVSDANNCSNTDDILITVYPTPTANFSSSSLCINDTTRFLNLSSGDANNWDWNFGDGVSSSLTSPWHVYSDTGSSNVVLTATGLGNCNSTLSMPITINPLPVILSVSSNSPVCWGDTIRLISSAPGSLNYSWSGQNNFIGSQQNEYIAAAVESMTGTYGLFVTDRATNCISSTSSVSVVVNEIPDAPLAEATKQLCFTDTLFLTTTTNAASYNWQGPNSYQSSLQNPIINNVNEDNVGIYTLIVANVLGCTSFDTVLVFLDCLDDDELNIPNVFTPNGDDKNQLFKFSVKDLKEIRVEIYNRWGVNVYSWNSLQDGWDGKTRNGMESPEGTYYYLVNATNWRGRTITQKGWFSLLR
jgi:gliding motility-associated-like protein